MHATLLRYQINNNKHATIWQATYDEVQIVNKINEIKKEYK